MIKLDLSINSSPFYWLPFNLTLQEFEITSVKEVVIIETCIKVLKGNAAERQYSQKKLLQEVTWPTLIYLFLE